MHQHHNRDDRASRGLKAVGHFLDRVKAQAGKGVDELANKADAAIAGAEKWVDTELKPAVNRAAMDVGDVVRGKGSVLARQVGAEIRECTSDRISLLQEAERTLAAFNREFKYQLKAKPILPRFLTSPSACLHEFDSTGTPVQGISVFPRPDIMQLVKGDFLPTRMFISGNGLMVRTYEEIPSAMVHKGKKYNLLVERPAVASDLVDLNVRLDELVSSLHALKGDPRVERFKSNARA